MFKAVSTEIRSEILDAIKAGTPVAKVSEQYGVSPKTIYSWLRKGVVEPVSLHELQRLRKENAGLKEIIGTLTIENAKIKKKMGSQ